ncbi:MAG: DUF454 domain-containing protein [Actinobacteria bacterium]|nr:DUF454 domain-containing protein [Actinomycetota bacterium]
MPLRTRHVRWLWLALAYLSAAVALVGVVVPVLPTTPFALLAAYAAARGSDRLHAWILAHPTLGPLVTAWHDGRRVGRRPKLVATATMAVSAAIMFAVAPTPWLAAGVTAFMGAVATWLWLRPEPSADERLDGAAEDARAERALPG